MSQEEKFVALKDFLDKNKFNFEKNDLLSKSFEAVFGFLNDRSKWRELQLVQENLVRFNSELRTKTEQSRKNTVPHVNEQLATEPKALVTEEDKKKEYSKSTIKESDELKVKCD
jgi:hypothetical protein